MMISLEEAKLQLRITDDEDSIVVGICIDAAVDIVEKHINKQIVLNLTDVDQSLIDQEKEGVI